VGCVGNYIYPEVSETTVELLLRSGFQVVVPAEQKCCGMPAWASGDLATAKSLARHNSLVFEESGCQWVVSACGTCATQLRMRVPELLNDENPDVSRSFRQHSIEVGTFIARQVQAEKLSRLLISPGPLKLSYHDPCHLRYHQSISQEPRQLLALLPEITLAELPGGHQCCGHGGLFNLGNYRLSEQIAARKMSQVKGSGPDVLATSCMGCLLQLQEGNWRHQLGVKVSHLVEVLMGRATG
jgi:glycolate oxidase iron-sulfur subunit